MRHMQSKTNQFDTRQYNIALLAKRVTEITLLGIIEGLKGFYTGSLTNSTMTLRSIKNASISK